VTTASAAAAANIGCLDGRSRGRGGCAGSSMDGDGGVGSVAGESRCGPQLVLD